MEPTWALRGGHHGNRVAWADIDFNATVFQQYGRERGGWRLDRRYLGGGGGDDLLMIDVSPLDRHERIAISFSGGKDSLAVIYLLREHLHRMTVYHIDTGDLLPEVKEVVAHVRSFCPSFVHIQGDVMGWISANGMPTDLLPFGSHPIGRGAGEEKVRLAARFDCCFQNLMWPLYARIKEDGNTLVIRGTKACDMNRMPARSGDNPDGVEIWLPIQDWSHDDVFAYLRWVGAPVSRIYGHVTNSPECARCTAWWGEKRALYLKQFYPDLFSEYASRLRKVASEIEAPLRNLQHEMASFEDVP